MPGPHHRLKISKDEDWVPPFSKNLHRCFQCRLLSKNHWNQKQEQTRGWITYLGTFENRGHLKIGWGRGASYHNNLEVKTPFGTQDQDCYEPCNAWSIPQNEELTQPKCHWNHCWKTRDYMCSDFFLNDLLYFLLLMHIIWWSSCSFMMCYLSYFGNFIFYKYYVLSSKV